MRHLLAADLIREGHADVITAGASDAAISPITVACFDAIKATSARNDSPETASRPIDRTRNGFVLGEGCAVFVLEELEHARRRDAHVYAELSGHASRCNAYSMTGLSDEGLEMSDAITAALDMSRFNPGEIAYVNAHGRPPSRTTGTKPVRSSAAWDITLTAPLSVPSSR